MKKTHFITLPLLLLLFLVSYVPVVHAQFPQPPVGTPFFRSPEEVPTDGSAGYALGTISEQDLTPGALLVETSEYPNVYKGTFIGRASGGPAPVYYFYMASGPRENTSKEAAVSFSATNFMNSDPGLSIRFWLTGILLLAGMVGLVLAFGRLVVAYQGFVQFVLDLSGAMSLDQAYQLLHFTVTLRRSPRGDDQLIGDSAQKAQGMYLQVLRSYFSGYLRSRPFSTSVTDLIWHLDSGKSSSDGLQVFLEAHGVSFSPSAYELVDVSFSAQELSPEQQDMLGREAESKADADALGPLIAKGLSPAQASSHLTKQGFNSALGNAAAAISALLTKLNGGE